jgi:hypothetical protein
MLSFFHSRTFAVIRQQAPQADNGNHGRRQPGCAVQSQLGDCKTSGSVVPPHRRNAVLERAPSGIGVRDDGA